MNAKAMEKIAPASPLGNTEPSVLPNGVIVSDLTLTPRAGLKGKGLERFLTLNELRDASDVNKAERQDDGSLIVKLADNEIAWLATHGAPPRSWAATANAPVGPDTYQVPRSHGNYWFRVTGETVRDGLARLCSVDFRDRSFANLDVAQTMLAKTTAIFIRDDEDGVLSFHLLGDISLANYMWDCLLKTMTTVE